MSDILVVDDHEPNLQLYKNVLGKLDGATARCYTEPAAALAWAKARAPLLVVVDQSLTKWGGLDFIASLRAIPGCESVPFVLVTAADERELRLEALRRGALGLLTQPVDPVEFLTLATNVVVARAKEIDQSVAARDVRAINALVAAMAARDPQLAAHGEQVAALSVRLATRIGLAVAERDLLADAARVHDVGKLAFSDRILTGATRLTPAERATLPQHVEHARAILAAFDESPSPVLRMAFTVAVGHHERWDGAGYPGGLRGDAIPVVARVVAVADAYCALTAPRAWRAAMSPGHALAAIEQARGSAYEPRVVAALRETVSAAT